MLEVKYCYSIVITAESRKAKKIRSLNKSINHIINPFGGKKTISEIVDSIHRVFDLLSEDVVELELESLEISLQVNDITEPDKEKGYTAINIPYQRFSFRSLKETKQLLLDEVEKNFAEKLKKERNIDKE